MERILIYRSATAADIPALQQLGLTAYGQFRQELSLEHWLQLQANLSSENLYRSLLEVSEGFVCMDENVLVGMAFLVPPGNPTDIYPADWSYIRLVGVHPDFSGLGIGRKLTLQCVAAARARGEKVIGLHTSEMMHAARHIYEDLGFRKLKEISPRFGKQYWLYRLSL